MRRCNLVFALIWLASITGSAQKLKIEDKELASLVEVVELLRVPSEANFNKAKQLLAADDKWTPMSETGKLQDTECKPSDKAPGFKLNRLLTSVGKERKYVATPGSMLNGEDERFRYSLYERSLKRGKAATYKLKKRYGKQTLVLVPFVRKKGCLTVMVDGKKTTCTEDTDGSLLCTFSYMTQKELVLTVANNSGKALSFVIINHNSRQK